MRGGNGGMVWGGVPKPVTLHSWVSGALPLEKFSKYDIQWCISAATRSVLADD